MSGSSKGDSAREGDVRPSPLSFAQERMWFAHKFQPGLHAYNTFLAYFLDGPLDTGALEASLGDIVRRHEALRTVFIEADGSPVQLVVAAPPFALTIESLEARDARDPEAAAARWAVGKVKKPFDLGRDLPIRAHLARLGRDRRLLVVVIHHIAFDGWSAGIFLRELSAVYAALTTDQPLPFQPAAFQYRDFAVWQRDRCREEVLKGQLQRWCGRLAGAPPVLELPRDRPRPRVQTFRGARLHFETPRALAEAVRTLGMKAGATLFMTLLAVFQVLLHRYTGQTDIVVGSPVANRNRTETEGLIGLLVNTLPLRADLSGDPSFVEFLARVRESALEAFDNQDVPFERLVEELQPERNLAYHPLFQVVFVLQNAAGDLNLRGLGSRRTPLDTEASLFDLIMQVEAGPSGLQGTIGYSTDLFDRATVERMASHYLNLLAGVVAEPDKPLSRLPLLSEAEVDRLLGWGANPVSYPRERSVPDLFREQAWRRPGATAVTAGAGVEPLTYSELDRRSDALAQRLRGLGVATDALVGVFLEPSPELVVALLGVLKAGGAYVPLDPDYPKERLAFMLEDTQARVIVTEERLLPRLPALTTPEGGPGEAAGRALLCLDRDRPPVAGQTSDARETAEPSIDPENLAYVIYTSGSTGRPKGVAVPHRAVVRLVKGADFAVLDDDQVVLGLAPVSFDASTLEIWGPLLNGGCLAIMPPGVPSLEEIGRFLQGRGVTTAWLTAGLFNLMVDEQPVSLGGLRQLLFGGEAASVPHVRKALAELPRCRLINGYGPTENTTFTTCYEVTGPAETARSIPIGRPISNTTVYILDPHLRPAPIGVPGELYTGGDGLARGYHARPDLTAECFVPDPFGARLGRPGARLGRPGARLYRTGDLARYLPDGNIEFLGRLDTQVKIRGFRVELGEIEAVLSRHASVGQVVVMARETAVAVGGEAVATGERFLAAYVVSAAESAAEPTQATRILRAYLAETLPDWMIPSVFVFLEALPLDPNGKVNRAALPAPGHSGLEAKGGYEAPRTPGERQLAEIWSEVLGLERVGMHDNFFELGGHSLLATRMVSRIRTGLGVEAPVRAVFEAPTLAALAEVLRRLGEAGHSPAASGPQRPPARTEELMERIDDLSEEELDALLAGLPEAP